ncbi:MAG TPA: DUF433 domain-containing protein [Conexibacter sp.]|jgi:uncharacterized protein (DUF433 family)
MTSSPSAIGFYTASDVARLAGVTPQRIGRWASEGIILPSVRQRPNIYSYADAGEAILAHYLVTQGKTPAKIKDVVHDLRKTYGPWPLATAPLEHDGSLVAIHDPERGIHVSVDKPNQDLIPTTLPTLRRIQAALAQGGWVALNTPRRHIEVDPDLHSGVPVVRGRRIPTSLVANVADSDGGRDVLRDDYGLSDDEIDDAVGYELDITAATSAAA